MDCWRSNAPRMKSDLTSLIILCPAPRARAGHKKNRMSKAPQTRGAFAIQCEFSVPQSFPQSVAAVTACSHYHSPIVQYGTVQRSDLAKSRLDDLCCMRTIPRWKRLALGFPTMYGSVGVGGKISIHPSVQSECTVRYDTEYANRYIDYRAVYTVR